MMMLVVNHCGDLNLDPHYWIREGADADARPQRSAFTHAATKLFRHRG